MGEKLAKTRQFAAYKDALLREAHRLRRNTTSRAASAILARTEEPTDMADLAGQSHEEWLFLNRNAQDFELLREINEALQRIDEGTYGLCADCAQPISPKRLAAVPWAKYCIECKEKRTSWAA